MTLELRFSSSGVVGLNVFGWRFLVGRRREVRWPAVQWGLPEFVIKASGLLPCRSDPDGWFSVRTTSEGAAALCEGCPVLAECLAYALEDRRLEGVWGGVTERERHLRRGREAERRRRAAKAAA